jgi:type I restriction enzyme, S subunit
MELRSGYKQTEIGVIPGDWEVAPLEAFTSFISYGFTNPMPTSESGVHMITAKDINYGKIQFETARTTTEEAYRNLLTAKSRPKKGDLLLTKDGTLGRLALVDDRTVCINQSVAVLRPNAKAVPKFLKTLLEAPAYQNRMLEDAGGSTIKHIYITIVNRMPLALPPTKAEQEAIAEALSDTDTLIESLEQLITKKRHIKQGAMQELLTGKKRLPGFSGEWEVKRLGDIGESLIGLTYKPSDVRSDGVLVLRSSNVFEGRLRFDDNVFVEMEILERIMVRTGDILICVRNGSRDLIGKCAKIDDRCEGMTFGAFMAVFRTSFNNFVFHQFQSDIIKRQIQEHLGATINQITNKSLNSFQITLPLDEAEQTAIATTLSDMDAEIANLEAKLAKTKQRASLEQVLLFCVANCEADQIFTGRKKRICAVKAGAAKWYGNWCTCAGGRAR